MWWYWALSKMCSKSLVHWLVHPHLPSRTPIVLAYLKFPESADWLYFGVAAAVPSTEALFSQLLLLGLFLNGKFLESSYLISLSKIALIMLSSHLVSSLLGIFSSHWHLDIYIFYSAPLSCENEVHEGGPWR